MKRKIRPNKVVFIGALPPPLTGMTQVSADIVKLIKQKARVHVRSTSPAGSSRNVIYHVSRASKSIQAIFEIPFLRLIGFKSIYLPVDDKFGGVWTAIFAFVGRIMMMQVYLHHHSYYYIIEPTVVMKILVNVAGPRARHIVLCEEMKAVFSDMYGSAKEFIVSPNPVAEPEVEAELQVDDQGALKLGLLSNLTEEKGVFDFLQICDDLRAQGLNVHGVIAGPISSEVRERFLVDIGKRSEYIEWMGPVTGSSKEKFFSHINLFVFPTKYRTESFGLVILESLIRGVPVFAPRRGCICIFEELKDAYIIPLDQDFKSSVISKIFDLKFYKYDACDWQKTRSECSMLGNKMNDEHKRVQVSLVEVISS